MAAHSKLVDNAKPGYLGYIFSSLLGFRWHNDTNCLFDHLVDERAASAARLDGRSYGAEEANGLPFSTTKVAMAFTGDVPLLMPSWILPGSM
jgi:hypothetical protein